MKASIIILLSICLLAYGQDNSTSDQCGCDYKVKCRHHWQEIFDYEVIECPPEQVVCPPDTCCVENSTYVPTSETNLTTFGSGDCSCNCTCECFSCSCDCNCLLPNLTVSPPLPPPVTPNKTSDKSWGKGSHEETGINLAEEHNQDFEEVNTGGV